MNNEHFYTVKEVAEIMRFSKSYVYELIKDGRLKAVRIGKGKIIVSFKDLQEFIDSGRL